MAEEESKESNPLVIFGTDVSKIPCFRRSFLYGGSAGVVSSLAVFVFTSKPQWASHAFMGALVTVTLSYWTFCRITWAEHKFLQGQMKGIYKEMIPMDSTDDTREGLTAEIADL